MIRHKTLNLHQITKSLTPNSLLSRSISLSSQFQHQTNEKSNKKTAGLSKTQIKESENEKDKLAKSLKKLEMELSKHKKHSTDEINSKPLVAIFTEAVGLSKNGQEFDIHEIENNDQESKTGLKYLSGLFMSSDQRRNPRKEVKKVEESMEFKELSGDMENFANYLYSKGYLNNANFLPNNVFDASCFVNSYGRDFLKFAAEKFAKDYREVYKWLPKNDLKTVARFGCPSVSRKNVFSAKAMRFCFGIQEDPVCNKCTLKESCKFANQSVWKKGAKNMDLPVVMRVITLYALDALPNQLKVPDDVKIAVNRLLKEVIRLSEIESSDSLSQLSSEEV